MKNVVCTSTSINVAIQVQASGNILRLRVEVLLTRFFGGWSAVKDLDCGEDSGSWRSLHAVASFRLKSEMLARAIITNVSELRTGTDIDARKVEEDIGKRGSVFTNTSSWTAMSPIF